MPVTAAPPPGPLRAAAASAAPPPAAAVKRLGKQFLSWPVFKPFWLLLGGAAYLLLRVLEPWRRFEVDLLEFDRIGHLCVNTDLYLRRRRLDPKRAEGVPFFFSGPPANRQLLDMIKRKVAVTEAALPRLFFMLGLRPFIEGTRFEAGVRDYHSNCYREYNQADKQLDFTPEEHARGRRLLREIGVPEGKPYVCFHARDSAYLVRAHSHQSAEQWSYHDFRNCSVENYLPAAEALVDGGLAAVRMGHIVEKPIAPSRPLLIDYATRHRSDFGDIYLMANAKFYLGNTSGLLCVAWAFDVPVAEANLVPIGWPPFRACDLFITKKYWDERRGRLLTFREIIAQGADYWNEAQEYERAGIRVVENSAEEIADLAFEMNARLDGTWVPRPEDEELQRRYRELFPRGRKLEGFPSRIGAEFIRENRSLLD